MRVAIIGAGLAGCAAGYFLKRFGADVNIYDQGSEVASGASGNDVGMVNPRFAAFQSPESLFYMTAFDEVLAVFESLGNDIGWQACGALHLITDEKKQKRYRQTVDNWEWPEERLCLVDAAQASVIAGVDLPYGGMYLPQSGSVSPRRLCGAMARGLEVHYNAPVRSLDDLDADVVIVANGPGAAAFLDMELMCVRGQITSVRPSEATQGLRVNLHYGGYVSANMDGRHTLGATFQREMSHCDVSDADDAQNIDRLRSVLPSLSEGFEVMDRRASVRTSARDYFPVIGRVDERVYVSTAHGSHGIVTSIGGAKLLSQMIMGDAVSFCDESVAALSPLRFGSAK